MKTRLEIAPSSLRVLVLTNMYPTPGRPAFGTFIEDQVESLRRAGVVIDVLFVNGSRNRLNYLLGFARLWARLLRTRYDLIHAHYIFSGIIARSQVSCPVVLTHHGAEVFRTWQAVVCRQFTPLFQGVIVKSREMKTRLGAPAAFVIPSGIDLELFQPKPRDACRAELGIRPDAEVVLWAGDRRPEKRYELVQEAITLLARRRPNVELITVTGQPHAAIPIFMNAADVLLLASDAEGSPNVVKEAMACNLPVVSTDVGDVAEIMNGTAGCFISRQDPVEFAKHLELALEFGRRTQGRAAVTHLDIDAIGARIIDVYRHTLAARRGMGRK